MAALRALDLARALERVVDVVVLEIYVVIVHHVSLRVNARAPG